MTGDEVGPSGNENIEPGALVAAALACDRQDEAGETMYWRHVGDIHKRGGEAEFECAKSLSLSSVAAERELGADILGQLAWGKPRPFDDESVTLLISALADPVETVVRSAAYALGHRRSARAIDPLIQLLPCASTPLRRAIVRGLSYHDDRRATDGLIMLCGDVDDDVRDWASFGLAELCIIDYPELRAELHRQLSDPNPEIRGQAMIGLARRGDRTCFMPIWRELRGDFHGIWAVEAAAHLADPALVGHLQAARAKILADAGPDHYVLKDVDAAITACRASTPVTP
jgi:HEAT repeat protein